MWPKAGKEQLNGLAYYIAWFTTWDDLRRDHFRKKRPGAKEKMALQCEQTLSYFENILTSVNVESKKPKRLPRSLPLSITNLGPAADILLNEYNACKQPQPDPLFLLIYRLLTVCSDQLYDFVKASTDAVKAVKKEHEWLNSGKIPSFLEYWNIRCVEGGFAPFWALTE
jgi:hypothetical protein